MSEPHDHSHPDHEHDHSHEAENPSASVAVALDDSGSQALSDALRSSFAIIKIIMVGLVIVFLGSGVFIVPPNQKAIVLHF
ncbi:MAG: hypothetical protein ABJC04_08420, partial [Verrucomicrobiota bacterium]